MNTILIGGAGFIGSHLGPAFRKAGHTVTAIDSLMVNNLYAEQEFSPLHREILQRRMAGLNSGDLIVADAREYTLLSPICKAIKPDIIIHLAAVAHQDRAQKSAHSTFDHSLRTLENALDIAINLKIKRFIYFSSSTVYGDWPASGVVDENTPCKPKGIYGALKLAGEDIVNAYAKVFDLDTVIIRPSALYGPGCVSGRVIQRFIEQASAGQELTAGGDRLDFTYIDDLVAGVLLAAQEPAARGQTYNLTYGEGRSILEAARLVQRRFQVTIKRAEDNSGFAKRGALSILKARRELSYYPNWSLERGIESYINWYKENGYAEGNASSPLLRQAQGQ